TLGGRCRGRYLPPYPVPVLFHTGLDCHQAYAQSLVDQRSRDGQPVGAADVAVLPGVRDRPERAGAAACRGRPACLHASASTCDRGASMNSVVAALMFPALFILIFLGVPISFSLIIPAVFAGLYAF